MDHHTATAERPRLSTPEADVVAELPLPDLLKRFGTDLSTLVREELTLARLELAEQAPNAAASAGFFAASAAFALGAFFASTVALVAALALALPLWAAAAIVAVVYAVVAAAAALRGKAKLAGVADPIPRVVRGLTLDVAAVKTGLGRGR